MALQVIKSANVKLTDDENKIKKYGQSQTNIVKCLTI